MLIILKNEYSIYLTIHSDHKQFDQQQVEGIVMHFFNADGC